jgi:hypothetical protein
MEPGACFHVRITITLFVMGQSLFLRRWPPTLMLTGRTQKRNVKCRPHVALTAIASAGTAASVVGAVTVGKLMLTDVLTVLVCRMGTRRRFVVCSVQWDVPLVGRRTVLLSGTTKC